MFGRVFGDLSYPLPRVNNSLLALSVKGVFSFHRKLTFGAEMRQHVVKFVYWGFRTQRQHKLTTCAQARKARPWNDIKHNAVLSGSSAVVWLAKRIY